jgi:methyltransferase (TIGR00027 family)
MIVACARAVAEVDPVAERLVPPALGAALRRVKGSRLVRVASLGLVDHMHLRTRAIDDVIERERPAQLVVLGAGLDARAWRMDALRDGVVFEVDHPSTQADKRESIGDAPPCAREVRFVGVDFERDDLAKRLEESGHDAAAPTTWIWEGVTQYLTRAAIGGTLDVVRSRSAPRSVIVVTYGTPDLGNIGWHLRALVVPAFRVLGEPLRGIMPISEATELVTSRGFDIEDDTLVADFAKRYGLRAPRAFIAERVLAARRR